MAFTFLLAPASTEGLFFLDINWMPAASRDSIQFHKVSL